MGKRNTKFRALVNFEREEGDSMGASCFIFLKIKSKEKKVAVANMEKKIFFEKVLSHYYSLSSLFMLLFPIIFLNA